MKPDNNYYIVAVIFAVFTPLLMVSFTYIQAVPDVMTLETVPGVEDTQTFLYDQNWNTSGTLNNLESDGDLIYPTVSDSGNWTFQLFDVPRNRVLKLDYMADMRDGGANITIYAWNETPNGMSPDANFTTPMITGDNNVSVGFGQYNFFQIVIDMYEGQNSVNKRPNVDSLLITFEIVEENEVGVGRNLTKKWYAIIWFFGVTTFMLAIWRILQVSNN